MELGAIFPQTEIGSDPIAIRDFAQAVEELGFHHIFAFEPIVGIDPEDRGFFSPYTVESMFHETFVLYGYLAGQTRRIQLVTSVLVLPQRQTVLVAKQAAEVDVLSAGRLRIGVGVGYNPVEFEAQNENFHDRGRRIEEQVEVLRKLWTEPVVDFHGTWHRIDRAGLNPRPVQRPIPIWFGGTAEPALKRIARIADGWMPNHKPAEGWGAVVARMRAMVQAAGRDVTSFGLEGRLNVANTTPDQWRAEAQLWHNNGFRHHLGPVTRFGSDVCVLPRGGEPLLYTIIKREDEIECLKAATMITEAGMDAALRLLRPGVRECELLAEAWKVFTALGSEWTQCANIITSGPSTVPYRRITSDRIIRIGDMVIYRMVPRFPSTSWAVV